MLKPTVSPTDACDLLNTLSRDDPLMVISLFNIRVPCNRHTADHPTVQVSSQYGGNTVGILGLLNGLFGTNDDGYGCITMVVDDSTGEVHFTTKDEKDEINEPKEKYEYQG